MSARHADPKFEINELLSEASHSSEFTVFVEGGNDVFLYSKINPGKGVHFQSVGDKEHVLELCKAIKNYSGNKTKFVCLVDQDLWALFGVPEDVKSAHLVTTNGYSIENDILCNSSVEGFYDDDELKALNKYKDSLSYWFAFQAENNHTNIKQRHEYPALEQVLLSNGRIAELNLNFLKTIGYVRPDNVKVEVVKNRFNEVFRGKHLLHLYVLLFSLRDSSVAPKYNAKQVVDIALKSSDTSVLKSVTIPRIASAFQKLSTTDRR